MSRVFDPDEIERELRDLEHQLSPAATRTTLYNLLVFTSENNRQKTDKLLAYLLGKRSIRLIQILKSDSAETSVKVSARCYPDRQNMGVCFQEIVITNGQDNAGLAPGTWQPLILRDLPLYILWMDSLKENLSSLPFFIERADKFVYNSEFMMEIGEAPDETAGAILEYIYKGELICADIVWKNLLNLRKTTARLFDHIPPTGGQPDGLYPLAKLIVTGGHRASIILYSAWLSSRLKRPVQFEHREPENPNITIDFKMDNEKVYQITRNTGGCGELSGPDINSLVQPCREEEGGSLLLQELDSVRTDTVFLEALHTLSKK
jgi:glucose-6-phosphate dehydrogenase assembly protein OpcA